MIYASGKVWKAKEQPKEQVNEDATVETEWDDILTAASEEELVDLAGKYCCTQNTQINLISPVSIVKLQTFCKYLQENMFELKHKIFIIFILLVSTLYCQTLNIQ